MKFSNTQLGLIFVSIGLFATVSSLIWHFYDQNNLSFIASESTFQSLAMSQRNQSFAWPVELAIPQNNIKVPIIEGVIKKGVWPLSETSAIHLSSTAFPSEKGRIVIYGHNYSSIFAKLARSSIGSQILVTDSAKNTHVYVISRKITVSPRDIEVLKPTSQEVLTIYTCTGPFDSQRLVVEASPIGQLLEKAISTSKI